jgi:hypothetical protein
MQHLAQRFNDGCAYKACITIRRLGDTLERRDESVSSVDREAPAQCCDGMGLAFFDVGPDQILP